MLTYSAPTPAVTQMWRAVLFEVSVMIPIFLYYRYYSYLSKNHGYESCDAGTVP